MLVNSKIDIKIKLALLWTTIMFLYIYADFFEAMTPASKEMAKNLETPVGPVTPELLILFSSIGYSNESSLDKDFATQRNTYRPDHTPDSL